MRIAAKLNAAAAAAALGSIKTAKKAAASRKNGKWGGRPRKYPDALQRR